MIRELNVNSVSSVDNMTVRITLPHQNYVYAVAFGGRSLVWSILLNL